MFRRAVCVSLSLHASRLNRPHFIIATLLASARIVSRAPLNFPFLLSSSFLTIRSSLIATAIRIVRDFTGGRRIQLRVTERTKICVLFYKFYGTSDRLSNRGSNPRARVPLCLDSSCNQRRCNLFLATRARVRTHGYLNLIDLHNSLSLSCKRVCTRVCTSILPGVRIKKAFSDNIARQNQSEYTQRFSSLTKNRKRFRATHKARP